MIDPVKVFLSGVVLVSGTLSAQPCTGGGGVNLNPTLFSPSLPTNSNGCEDCPVVYSGEVNAANNVPIFLCTGNLYSISLCNSELSDLTVSITTGPPGYAPVAVFFGADFDDDGCGMDNGLPSVEFSPAVNGIHYIRIREHQGNDPCTTNASLTGTLDIACSIPAPPVNDDPCDATELIISDLCVFQAGETAWSTGASQFSDPPNCAPPPAGYVGDDVWYVVTVPPSGELAISTALVTAGDLGISVYQQADCDAVDSLWIELDCLNGGSPTLELTGLDPELPAYIRVWYNLDIGNMGSFQICAYDPIMLGYDPIGGSFASEHALVFHPNPAVGAIQVVGIRAGEVLAFHSPDGREVKRVMAKGDGPIDVSGLPVGVYVVHRFGDQGIKNGRLVIQR